MTTELPPACPLVYPASAKLITTLVRLANNADLLFLIETMKLKGLPPFTIEQFLAWYGQVTLVTQEPLQFDTTIINLPILHCDSLTVTRSTQAIKPGSRINRRLSILSDSIDTFEDVEIGAHFTFRYSPATAANPIRRLVSPQPPRDQGVMTLKRTWFGEVSELPITADTRIAGRPVRAWASVLSPIGFSQLLLGSDLCAKVVPDLLGQEPWRGGLTLPEYIALPPAELLEDATESVTDSLVTSLDLV